MAPLAVFCKGCTTEVGTTSARITGHVSGVTAFVLLWGMGTKYN